MTFQEITELIKALSKSRLAEFKMKDGDFEISVKTDRYVDTKNPKVVQAPLTVAAAPPTVVSAPAPAAPAPAPAAPASTPPAKKPPKEEKPKTNYIEVKSPMVGTFYRSANPETPPFVEVGDTISPGKTVCIIEAMKLFNEIEAEVSGKIVKVMVENSKPVEFDQVLFLVEPQ